MAMPSGSDHHNNDYYNSQPSGFLTPPPTWRTRRCSPVMPGSEKKPRRSPQSRDYLFHVIYKVPSGDSPYVRAKHAQLIDKDPSRAISLFWAAINSGDRVDSALKDMAVVMKQLDRSDEAIEAIKSFRHLCPSESQESLDNILVELYKQSGRIEEEIEILQIKLKQVEEGIAFGGKRTKMARSQGKKTQITIEKEYSRLLGNLAWAYMQKRDFKFAEEHYRKALSFESDKNKQCNLAICLMHMNKLTEAKFLLQAIKVSSDNGGQIDESHAKSYERAYEMLVEFESQAMKHRQHTNDNNGMQSSSPLPSSVNKMHNGAFTDFPYEKRADSDRGTNRYQLKIGQEEGYSQPKRTHESSPSCNRIVQKVPFTQPRRRSRSGDQRMGGFTDNAHGFSCRKLAFGSSTVPFDEMPQFSEKNFTSTGQEWRKNSSVKMSETNLDGDLPSDLMTSSEDGRKTKEILTNSVHIGTSDTKDERNLNLQTGWRRTCELSTCQHKKSWADMVEEDERDLGRCLQNCSGKFGVGLMDHQERFNDENVDSNIIPETPKSLNEAEKLSQKIELIDLGSGYFTQPENNTTLQVNPSARRSLCFDQDVKKCGCTSPLTTRVLKFEEQDEGALSKDFSSMKSMKRRNRLQVFRDITLVSESPRH